MPELPEVERFRQLLLPLVSSKNGNAPLTIERVAAGSNKNASNKRIELTDEDLHRISTTFSCTDIVRKGKQLCLILVQNETGTGKNTPSTHLYLMLHMGMTGQIRVPGVKVNWGAKQKGSGEVVLATDVASTASNDEHKISLSCPPKYAWLVFRCQSYVAFFCDPRKFGHCFLAEDASCLDALAPDALLCTNEDTIQSHILPALTDQRLGIKAILLDQKRAVSGVGNWFVLLAPSAVFLHFVIRLTCSPCPEIEYSLLRCTGWPMKFCINVAFTRTNPTYPTTKRDWCGTPYKRFWQPPSLH